MGRKAISTVIASILMLMIVIGLGGTTYLYISGIFTGKTAAAFEIIDAVNDTVIIRNSGTDPITSITSSLDGNVANIAVVPNIQGLVAYWSFNEGSGTTTDDNSQNNNVGTLKPSCPDCPSWTTGKYGNALGFDGVNDYVDAGNDASLFPTQALSVEAWVNRRIVTTWRGILTTQHTNNPSPGYSLFTHNNDVYFNIGDNAANDGNAISTFPGIDQWVHVVGTWDGSTVKIYVNGKKGTDDSINNINYDANAKLGIGQLYFNQVNPDWAWDGIIDEVRIYNRALSTEEIKQVYSGLVSPGQLASIKPLTSLTKGTHTLRLCTTSMCNTAILTII